MEPLTGKVAYNEKLNEVVEWMHTHKGRPKATLQEINLLSAFDPTLINPYNQIPWRLTQNANS